MKSVKDPVAFDKPVGTGPFTEVDNSSAQLYQRSTATRTLLGQRQPLHRLPAHAADGRNDQVLAVMKG